MPCVHCHHWTSMASFRSMHGELSISLMKVTSITVTTPERNSMCHQRWIITEGSVVVQEWMGKGAVKVLSRRSSHGHPLKEKAIMCVLQQYGTVPHKAHISNDYLVVEHVEKLWWSGHSPEINAIEHAWSWVWRHVTKQFTLFALPSSVRSSE